MELFEIALIAIVFLAIIVIPLLRKFIIFQFISLVLVAFIFGFLFIETLIVIGLNIQNSILLILLTGGLIYQSMRFYRANIN